MSKPLYGDADYFVRTLTVGDWVKQHAADLHPTDRAESFRKIEKHYGECAKAQENYNDKHGVPDNRPADKAAANARAKTATNKTS